MTLTDLLYEHVAASADKQYHLADDVLEGRDAPWQVDMQAGTITFTVGRGLWGKKRPAYAIQVLGTQSSEDNTWLWAWANEASNIPERLLRAARRMRELGEREGIPELVEPQLPATAEVNGHILALIASGVCGANCFYPGDSGPGVAYLLIDDPNFPHPAGRPNQRVAFTSPKLIMDIPLNHRRAFVNYLRYYGMDIAEDGDRVTGTIGGGDPVVATFDEHGRLTGLETALRK